MVQNVHRTRVNLLPVSQHGANRPVMVDIVPVLQPRMVDRLLTTTANGFQHVPFLLPNAGVQLIDDVPDTPLGFLQPPARRQSAGTLLQFACVLPRNAL